MTLLARHMLNLNKVTKLEQLLREAGGLRVGMACFGASIG